MLFYKLMELLLWKDGFQAHKMCQWNGQPYLQMLKQSLLAFWDKTLLSKNRHTMENMLPILQKVLKRNIVILNE